MRWILCGALLSLCVPVYSQEPPKAPRIEAKEQTEDSPQANKKPEANPQTIAPAPSLPSHQEPKINAEKRSEDTSNTSNEASEYWTIGGHSLKITDSLLVVFTALLFTATLFLYCATRSLVTGAEETARRQLRAYISLVKAIQVENTVNPGLAAYATTIRNSGQTPAYEITSWWGIGVQKHPLTGRLGPPPNPTPGSDVILGNGAEQGNKEEVRTQFSPREMQDVRSGVAAIYVWGRIEYRDCFNHRHFTNFCLFQTDPVGGILRYSRIGNDAD